MRFAVTIDAACDLPHDFLLQHGVTVLPTTVKVDGETFMDDRSPAETRRFIERKLGDRSHEAETASCPVEAVERLFLDKLVLHYDCVFCLTITATRSTINDNVHRASYRILMGYREARSAIGAAGPFMMRVIDTRNLFAGAAPAVFEATRMIAGDHAPAAIRARLAYVADNSYGYMLPRDLYYLRARAKKKNDRSVGWLGATLGSALDVKPLLRCYRGDTGAVGKVRGFESGAKTLLAYAARQVREGLLVPAVCVSYGGDLSTLGRLPGYSELCDACAATGVTLLEAPMSITGMINVGEGALSVGFATRPHAAEF
ncbi:MAG: DegV family protein [Xanthomonadales bacterium]|nr:DegV family protein [Xanthomonadales bacterium]